MGDRRRLFSRENLQKWLIHEGPRDRYWEESYVQGSLLVACVVTLHKQRAVVWNGVYTFTRLKRYHHRKEGTNRGKAIKGSNLSELYGSLTAVKGFRANKEMKVFVASENRYIKIL
ncbi:hypothetical protein ISN44_As07g011230 [Arabidopsis suecica]|uniref:Uncharacterized protein n=1 Tax=Arabidopsis suecica TaxID=45249 RepID=A0A8T2BT40_ARASU|nr:hypothetical protein ISN44_As07g011230 [Arabidopsis suecica]